MKIIFFSPNDILYYDNITIYKSLVKYFFQMGFSKEETNLNFIEDYPRIIFLKK